MGALLEDVRHSTRMFLRAPGFTAAAVATLALGIAANTAMFSVVDAILLKPFAYRDPERIVMFQNTLRGVRFGSTAPTEFNWWRQQTGAFEDIAAYDFDIANWTGESSPEQIPTMHVSADFFRLGGAGVARGRLFAAADDLPHAPKVAVLAWAFWQRRFGGDRRVIGRRLTLNGERYEIIGVASPALQNGQVLERSTLSGDIEVHAPPDVYLAFQIDPNSADHGHSFNVTGRLKPGITLAAANQQLAASYPDYARQWPLDNASGRGFAIQPLQEAITSAVRKSLLILFGAVGFVLLIACANAANLLLARAAGRKREMAIRAAVGARRSRIVRQLLTESAMLSLAGGAAGLAAGYAGMRALLTLLPGNIPRIGVAGSNVSFDWRILGFVAGLSILTGIAFGLVPAMQSSRTDLSGALKGSSHQTGAGRRHNHTRSLLVSAEMALALVLSVGAALLIRSFVSIRQVNPGFDAHRVLTMRMSMNGPQFENPAEVSRVVHDGLRRIRALPGIEAAAAACCLPLEDHWLKGFRIAGRPEGPDSQAVAGWTLASAGYFEAFRIPVLRGRVFTERDETGPPVVVINQTLARQFWPHGDPLNDQIVFAGEQTRRQIIGVVGDVRDEFLSREPRPNLYVPSAAASGSQAWVIRTHAGPRPLSTAIQTQLREASGDLPVAEVRTMDEILSRSMAAENFNTLVLSIFASAALFLAAIGIYGVMAYSVAQRVQEIGIRLALGAGSSRIRNMVVLQGLRSALAGTVCGLAGAFALTRLIAGLLFGVRPRDPLVFSVVPVMLMAVALLSVWLPARRASRLDPGAALRDE